VLVSKLSDAKGIAAGGQHSLAFGPPPTVASLKPNDGPISGGTTVTITGADFTGATAVKFGSTSASSFTVTSSTSITVVSPPGPGQVGSVDVTVTNTWGSSAISAADRFGFRPTVTGLSPNSGPAAGGTFVTVTGAGFAPGTTATQFRFGKKRAKSVECTSTTTCTVVAPRHRAGRADVTATVSGLSSATNRPADQFKYV
jgi:hypothetical protein